MGTNYYWIRDRCPTCGRGESLHIGKSSVGWQFLFQGYRERDWDDTPVIESYTDWLKLLEGGAIQNEYGDSMTLVEFRQFIQDKRAEPHNHALEYPGDDTWIDDEGHPFSDREFT